VKNILVTGGAGFIGTNFIRYLASKCPDLHITNLDALTYAGNVENLRGLPTQHTFVKGSINDRELVGDIVRSKSIDTIVHFAAESHVDRSIEAPKPFIKTNINGTYTLLEQARQSGIRFHHVSTDEVYGSLGASEAPWTEDSPYRPNSPYAASKASSDHLARAYWHTYGLPVTITNCSNNYGPWQHPEKLIPMAITHALLGKPIPVYGDGLQVRDWVYVEDHCRAILTVLVGGVEGETYNVGGNCQLTNMDVVETICRVLGRLDLIYHAKDRPGHDRRYAIDWGKAIRELGWAPTTDFASGMGHTIGWYRKNRSWWEAILKS